MTIEVYPSTLPGEPIEIHEFSGTLDAWLSENVDGYCPGSEQPITATVDGVMVDPSRWSELQVEGCLVELRPMLREATTLLYTLAAVVLAPTILKLFMPKMPSGADMTRGQELQSASAEANTPRMYGVVPEIAGRCRVYPDYLVQPRRSFIDLRTEAIDMLLSIGVGSFGITNDEVYIGETPLSTLGDEVEFGIIQPGASVAGYIQHQNWYNVPEVGANRSGAGLRLIDEDPATPTGSPSTVTGTEAPALSYSSPETFTVSGDSVTVGGTYADIDAFLADVISQLDPAQLTATITSDGFLQISEVYPYAGVELPVTGTIAGAFGATYSWTVGSITLGLFLGPFRLTPPNESARYLEFDVFAPNGFGTVDGSNVNTRTKTVELQWRTNDGTWNSITNTVTAATKDQSGWTFSADLGAEYSNIDVRFRRWGIESTNLSDLDRLEWYGMRCKLPAVTSYAGITTMAIRVKGTDRLSASSENKINAIVTRKLNGVATQSIAEWVRYVCTNIGYSSDNWDETELAALESVWATRGDVYNLATTSQTTVKDALAMALRAGFSELTIDGGRIRPVRDQTRTVYEHLYTSQNMLGPVRRQFSSYDPDDFDGVDIEYLDDTSWEYDTVECRLPGDVGVRVEKIKLEGVTDRTRAWRIGMRARRAHAYRRKTYKFSTEMDALNSRYLSFCAISDDVPGYGQSALLAVIIGSSVTVTELFKWTDGQTHVIAFRRPDGTLNGPFTATRTGDYTMTIAGSLDFIPVTGASSTEQTHVLFGTSTRWSYPVLITDISPSGDSVDVTAVNYDVRIYADDDNAPA